MVIPTKNGGLTLSKCLGKIEEQSGDFETEVVIVDSESQDDTLEIVRDYNAVVRSIAAESFTHGYARNLGGSLSDGEILVFINQDVVPIGNDWLHRLVGPLSNGMAASYSRQIPPQGTPYHERVLLRHFYPAKDQIHCRETLRDRTANNLVLFSTVAGAIKKTVWRELRFNETIIMGEDQEFACRALLTGQRIRYESTSMVHHANLYSLPEAFRRYFDSGWSMTSLPRLKIGSQSGSARFLLDIAREMLLDNYATPHEKLSGFTFLFCKTLGFGLGSLAPYMPEIMRSRISLTKSIVPRPAPKPWS
jgi:rhamnosyltransferase